jgi:hypothetical protein
MTPDRLVSREDVEYALDQNDFEPTGQRTSTGEIWRHKRSKRNIQIPDDYGGLYPDWMIGDWEQDIGPLTPGMSGQSQNII